MDINSCKERFSDAYLRALAAVIGCSASEPVPDDDSEDLVLSKRFTGTAIRSPKLGVQLKCSAVLDRADGEISFPLPLKNYDDLRPTNLAVPRILVVVEVPGDDPGKWLDQSAERLCLLRTAWWISLFGYKATANSSTISIRIPIDQRLTAAALSDIMVRLGNGERP